MQDALLRMGKTNPMHLITGLNLADIQVGNRGLKTNPPLPLFNTADQCYHHQKPTRIILGRDIA
jgi:hypothetical protein